eukprot:15331001-Ditylum_brightwellii.AAC.1
MRKEKHFRKKIKGGYLGDFNSCFVSLLKRACCLSHYRVEYLGCFGFFVFGTTGSLAWHLASSFNTLCAVEMILPEDRFDKSIGSRECLLEMGMPSTMSTVL